MRRKFLLGTAWLAFAGAGGSAAIAADIGARPIGPPPTPPPSYISDWAGFYIGINGGGGWARSSYEPQSFSSLTIDGVTASSSSFTPPNASPSGGIFGFQAGHNWQWGPVVGGLEIDFDGADIKDSSTFVFSGFPFDTFTHDAKLDELASTRARLGYLIFPNWLIYGTTGLGWGHFRFDSTHQFAVDGVSEFTSTSNFANEFGWVVGAGLEWKFFNNWLLRGEYLHYDFGKDTIVGAAVVPGLGFPVGTFNVRNTVDIARAALSYKF
jgi:outer membrane immunogenic protein